MSKGNGISSPAKVLAIILILAAIAVSNPNQWLRSLIAWLEQILGR